MRCELRWVFCVAAYCITGCAGNGEGLDENGRPLDEEDDAPLTASLQSIQDNVFTPVCTGCHAGAAAPVGLRLEDGASFAMLVNAPSTEVPSLNRVTPGDPDASYLIRKLEGTAAVGAQMPLGQPPLPQATIAVIRQWIANGAQASSASAPAVMPMQLHAIATPLNTNDPVLVQADGELKISSLSVENVRLVRSGGDGTFGEGNEVQVGAVQIDVRSLDPTVLAIRIENGAWAADRYQLTISGQDRDGLPFAEFAMQFNAGGSL